MVRMGRLAGDPFSDFTARSRESHASTQAMESSIFVRSLEGVRSYCGEAYQTAYRLSREPRSRIGSQGGRCVGRGCLVELFYVSLYCFERFYSTILTSYFSTDFMGDMA